MGTWVGLRTAEHIAARAGGGVACARRVRGVGSVDNRVLRDVIMHHAVAVVAITVVRKRSGLRVLWERYACTKVLGSEECERGFRCLARFH